MGVFFNHFLYACVCVFSSLKHRESPSEGSTGNARAIDALPMRPHTITNTILRRPKHEHPLVNAASQFSSHRGIRATEAPSYIETYYWGWSRNCRLLSMETAGTWRVCPVIVGCAVDVVLPAATLAPRPLLLPQMLEFRATPRCLFWWEGYHSPWNDPLTVTCCCGCCCYRRGDSWIKKGVLSDTFVMVFARQHVSTGNAWQNRTAIEKVVEYERIIISEGTAGAC